LADLGPLAGGGAALTPFARGVIAGAAVVAIGVLLGALTILVASPVH
jgi:hypothetical protein